MRRSAGRANILSLTAVVSVIAVAIATPSDGMAPRSHRPYHITKKPYVGELSQPTTPTTSEGELTGPRSSTGRSPASLHWTSVPIANFASNHPVETGNMVCLATNACYVAGYTTSGGHPAVSSPFILSFNGHDWKSDVTGVRGSAALVSTDCQDARVTGVQSKPGVMCWSVGAFYNGAAEQHPNGLIDELNGTTWSKVAVPAASGVSLNGVACPNPAECLAVGNLQTSANAAHAAAYKWSGKAWASMGIPSPHGALWTVLTFLGCPSSAECIALGDARDSPSASGYFFWEKWSGHAWSLHTMPNPTTFDLGDETGLSTMSCLANGACIAAGQALGYTDGAEGADWPAGVAYRRAGNGAWTSLTVPKTPLESSSGVNAGACDGTSCWLPLQVVGPVNGYEQPLRLALWTGGGLVPYTSRVDGFLDAVACVHETSRTWCIGVGEGPHGATYGRPISGEFSPIAP